MKNLLILPIITLLSLNLSANTQQDSGTLIRTLVDEIKPPRTGVKASDVLKTKSPFLLFSTTKQGKKVYAPKKHIKLPPLKMESSINKSVKINGKWYQEGDRVRQYTIVKVSAGKVLLKSKKKQLQLFQDNGNEKINFKVN